MQVPELRKFPYPYKAALSITSDIDCTDTYEKYKKIQMFMNEEVGIRFTNTFFPFHDQRKFSMLSGSSDDKKIIIDHIKKGMIDAIHSFGEKKDFTRKDALLALKDLKENDCKLEVWIDHAESNSNFCKYRYFGKGDIPGSPEYHFDLTKKYGVKFIWTERLTNLIGQAVPLRLKSILGIYDTAFPIHSMVNMAKTTAKVLLDYLGYRKYNYFKNNVLINISTMRDGQKIYEFIRFNNYYKGASIGDTFEELAYIISKRVLDKLKKEGGYSIAYVHLGKKYSLESSSGKKSAAALRNLKNEYECGNIYVDSASNILNYYLNTTYLNWSSEMKNGRYNICIKSINDPIFGKYIPKLEQLSNITYYVPGSVKVFLGEKEITQICHNPPDHTGKKSITILGPTSVMVKG
jgi:hypothetical protein